MKRILVALLAMVLIMSWGMSSAFAVDILPKDEEVEATEAPTEPLATPDPRAVLVGGDQTEFVENGEGEDKGTVWISWNGQGYAKYGCTTASINYTNPAASNIGVTLKVAIFIRAHSFAHDLFVQPFPEHRRMVQGMGFRPLSPTFFGRKFKAHGFKHRGACPRRRRLLDYFRHDRRDRRVLFQKESARRAR